MQQVFQLVNILLAQDRESKRRELSLRTYKVVPLPEQTGLLQFVDNTQTFGSWVTKAHARSVLLNFESHGSTLSDTTRRICH